MGRYIIRRILQAIPLLFLLSIAMFGLIHLLPGGADAVLFNPRLTAAARAALRAVLAPWYIRSQNRQLRLLLFSICLSSETREREKQGCSSRYSR
jgi:ABC-type dipeptide/oligopeptide/nickel transport system permease component